jgi:hypothetical protein
MPQTPNDTRINHLKNSCNAPKPSVDQTQASPFHRSNTPLPTMHNDLSSLPLQAQRIQIRVTIAAAQTLPYNLQQPQLLLIRKPRIHLLDHSIQHADAIRAKVDYLKQLRLCQCKLVRLVDELVDPRQVRRRRGGQVRGRGGEVVR